MTEPCPMCNEADLEDRKAKLVCPGCGFQVPCCEGSDLPKRTEAVIPLTVLWFGDFVRLVAG